MRFVEEFVEQRSPEWLTLHIGVITASNAIGLSTPARRKTMGLTLAYESLSHHMPERGITDAMADGIESEAAMKARYRFDHDGDFRDIGFAWHPEFVGMAGCSPDLIWEDGNMVVEFKRRAGIQAMRDIVEGPKAEDLWQLQFQLWVMDAEYAHFVVSSPVLRSPFEFCVTRVDRDPKIFDKIPEYVKEVIGLKKENMQAAEEKYGHGEIYNWSAKQ